MIWTELVCDVCSDVFTEGAKPAQLRAGAKRRGWTYAWSRRERRMVDLCPTCGGDEGVRRGLVTARATGREA